MPTAEEWKFAAAFDGTYPWGADWESLLKSAKPFGNYAGTELKADKNWPPQFKTIAGYSDGWKRTAPVGTYPANRFGLFDMSGNVAEWCSNGTQSTAIANGGSWCSRDPEDLQLTPGEELPSNTRTSRIGFRVIAVPDN
jgi:formylglycine-generating enzyme required for sulfatase activity